MAKPVSPNTIPALRSAGFGFLGQLDMRSLISWLAFAPKRLWVEAGSRQTK